MSTCHLSPLLQKKGAGFALLLLTAYGGCGVAAPIPNAVALLTHRRSQNTILPKGKKDKYDCFLYFECNSL
jgi:hypothetical protein